MSSNIPNWVERLKKAFQGWGTDEDEVEAVLKEAQGHMRELNAAYPELEDELYSELNKKELKQYLPLYYEVNPDGTDPGGARQKWVDDLYQAFNAGIFGGVLGGTDEDTVMRVLGEANTPELMGELTALYNQQHGSELSLEDELYDELGGKDLKEALRLFYTGFPKKPEAAETSPSQPPAGSLQLPPRFPLSLVDVTLVPGPSIQELMDEVDAERARIGLYPLNGNVNGLSGNVYLWPQQYFDQLQTEEQDLWTKMQNATRLIEMYDRAYKRESRDIRDFVVEPLMTDIFNPIVNWLPLVPDSLKPDLKDAIRDGLKSGIFSLIETAVDNADTMDDTTKKALKEAAKAGISLKFPNGPPPISGTSGGSSGTGGMPAEGPPSPDDATEGDVGPEEGKPYKAPGETIVDSPSIPIP